MKNRMNSIKIPTINGLRFYIRKVIFGIFEFIFRMIPLQDKVVFDNFVGQGMGDDPKYIALELLNTQKHPALYWIVKDNSINLPDCIKPIKLNSLKSLYHLCTAKVWVDNVKNHVKPNKRKGQYYIQTWHAMIALKCVEEKVPNLPTGYIKRAVRDAAMTDLMYSNNDFEINLFKNTFWYNGRVIKCDEPRMSILINPKDNLRQMIYDYFHIEKSYKIALYAPTFRQDHSVNSIRWDYYTVLESLEKKFDSKFVLLLRLHPNVVDQCNSIEFSNRIINASKYPDMQELLSVSDILINDYSSSMFDFGYLRKPVFLICQDLEDYIASGRNLEFSIENLPFIFSRNVVELNKKIAAFDIGKYISDCNTFYNELGLNDKGYGAKVLSDIIMKHIYRE